MGQKLIVSRRLFNLLPEPGAKVKIGGHFWCSHIDVGISDAGHARDNWVLNIETQKFNYFDVRGGKITAWDMTKGEQPVNDNEKWLRSGRVVVRPAKFLFLFKQVTDFCTNDPCAEREPDKCFNQLIEIFVAKITAHFAPIKHEISDDVLKIYDLPTANNNVGNLADSCLRPNGAYGCREHIKLLGMIPKLKVVYGVNGEGSLMFRALLWTVKTDEGERQFLDRPYGSDGAAQQLYELAEKNDWLYRTMNDNCIRPDHVHISVDVGEDFVEYCESEGTTYFDTVCMLDGYALNNFSGERLQDCDGSPLNGCCCDNCGCGVDEDYAYFVSGRPYCEDCYHDMFYSCQRCDVTVVQGDDIYIEDKDMNVCQDCAEYYYRQCYECNQYFSNYIETTHRYICEGCVEKFYNTCETCGELVREDEDCCKEEEEERPADDMYIVETKFIQNERGQYVCI